MQEVKPHLKYRQVKSSECTGEAALCYLLTLYLRRLRNVFSILDFCAAVIILSIMCPASVFRISAKASQAKQDQIFFLFPVS